MGVSPATAADQVAARALASALDLPLLPVASKAADMASEEILLTVEAGLPAIVLAGRGAPGPVYVDFADRALAERRRAGHNELLGRAVGWKAKRAPAILDTTGGFGRDAFLLADLGCDVLVCERHPLMAQLLAAALERGVASGDRWLREVCGRMALHRGDTRELGRPQLLGREVIYLDPMFPADRRAAPAKEMQVLHRLVAEAGGSDDDGSELFAWALQQPVRRVVVKRPRRAPPLPGPAPGHSLQGRSVRFDVYPRPVPEVAATRGGLGQTREGFS